MKKLRQTQDIVKSRQVLIDEFQPIMTSLMTDEELDHMSERIRKLPEPSKRLLLTGKDLLAGVEIFLFVFLCTLPVALPFMFAKDITFALRASNGVALIMLFIGGYLLAGYAGFRRILTAIIYTLIGVFLVSVTMALGG